MRADVNSAEGDCFKMVMEKKLADACVERAADGAFKQKLQARVMYANLCKQEDRAACETETAQLKQEQSSMSSVHEGAANQMHMWRDFARIMDAKQKAAAHMQPQHSNARA